MKVYTAGGMRSNWRDNLIGIAGIEILKPKNRENENEYTSWDIECIKRCDICFAYLEINNPSGVGMAVEIAYAKAIGKLVILVDEKHLDNFGMCRSLSDVVFNTLAEGINYLSDYGDMP